MSLTTLIDSNLAVLKQAIDLLAGLSEQDYCRSEVHGAPSSVGKHLRHIIEHYQSFFTGLDDGVINYNKRPRCINAETSGEFATQAIRDVIARLQGLNSLQRDVNQQVEVFLQTTVRGDDEPAVGSTLARELVFLHGHAVHHFAQLSSQLQIMGLSIDTVALGKAPSTIEYETKLAAQAARSPAARANG